MTHSDQIICKNGKKFVKGAYVGNVRHLGAARLDSDGGENGQSRRQDWTARCAKRYKLAGGAMLSCLTLPGKSKYLRYAIVEGTTGECSPESSG
jgi:hypothetical protein